MPSLLRILRPFTTSLIAKMSADLSSRAIGIGFFAKQGRGVESDPGWLQVLGTGERQHDFLQPRVVLASNEPEPADRIQARGIDELTHDDADPFLKTLLQ